MAANLDQKWQELLPRHPVFEEARQANEDQIANGEHERRSKNILVENDCEIFVWVPSRSTILTANLKNLHFGNERSAKFQTFTCTEAPLFEVHSILFSSSSKYLVLIGRRGLSVLEMPRRWGKFAEYDGGSQSVLCRTIPIDERFFVTHEKVAVLDVKWHPGSHADIHLMVLTSDNNLRLYNVLKPTSPEEIIPLGESSSLTAEYSKKSMSFGSTSSFAVALGESAIAFDFGPAVVDFDPSTKFRASNTEVEHAHSVFVLQETGDVYHLLHRLSQKRRRPQLNGPLTMYPAADDNYGQDACSLLCLHSHPPVIVMATTGGRIYHCIVLESGDSDPEDADEEIAPWNRSGLERSDNRPSNFSLFVNECVELQLSLVNELSDSQSEESSVGDDSVEADISSSLHLQKDPGSPYQYHCIHGFGVHSLTLPWAEKLQGFCCQDAEEKSYFDPNEASVVYHMVCTSPVGIRSLSPVKGMCVLKDRILGSAMICLTSKMECIVKTLSLLNRAPSPVMIDTDEAINYGSNNLSPIRHLNDVGLFKKQIEQMLTRNTSSPLLKADESTEKMSQQDCYQLLAQAQEIMRKEYIQKQNKARDEIEKRISILKGQRRKQDEDMQKLETVCEELQESTERLGGKLVDTSEKQFDLLKRLEAVFQHIHVGLPGLSHSESRMKQELGEIEAHLRFFRESLQQVEVKKKYNSRQKRRNSSSTTSPVVNANQQNRIRKVLCEENQLITDLVSQVKELKLQVGL